MTLAIMLLLEPLPTALKPLTAATGAESMAAPASEAVVPASCANIVRTPRRMTGWSLAAFGQAKEHGRVLDGLNTVVSPLRPATA